MIFLRGLVKLIINLSSFPFTNQVILADLLQIKVAVHYVHLFVTEVTMSRILGIRHSFATVLQKTVVQLSKTEYPANASRLFLISN